MILQAVPYFQKLFKSNAWIRQYFQSLNLCVLSITMLSSTLVLSKSNREVVYERHLRGSLLAYVLVASLLTISTTELFAVSPEIYLIFLLVMVFITAVANTLSQNAAFAFAARFGRIEYAPAIMTGEALAGLLPSTVGK
jgi:equilibrative nucleoside transporter 1/2/3